MTFEVGAVLRMMTSDDPLDSVADSDVRLVVRATRLHELVKARDSHFRRSVMADGAMAIMLSLFLGELKAVALTASTLSLVNMLDESETFALLDSLIQAGLAVTTGDNPERRSVGLTALGSARMRSFVSDYPEI